MCFDRLAMETEGAFLNVAVISLNYSKKILYLSAIGVTI